MYLKLILKVTIGKWCDNDNVYNITIIHNSSIQHLAMYSKI